MNTDVKSRKGQALPIMQARSPAEYIPGDQELPVAITSLRDMITWAQNW